MEFQVGHISELFHPRNIMILLAVTMMSGGILVPCVLNPAMAEHEKRITFLLGLFIVLLVLSVICLILFLLERITGAKIIVNHDHIIIRKLLRHRRKIFCLDIMNARYSYHDTVEDSRYLTTESTDQTPGLIYRHLRKDTARRPPDSVALLEFELVSGERISLNDHNTKSYNQMLNRAKVDPAVNPNAYVRLYQAYQCYCAAVDQYARENGLQIPR